MIVFSFEQYIGQETLIRRLKIAVDAAKGRKEPVEHVLLHGPPGLGKTTLAHVIANEVKAQVHVTNGPALTKGADLVGILTKLGAGRRAEIAAWCATVRRDAPP